MTMMDFEAQQQLTRELASGERLLWAGKPRQGIFTRRSDAFVIPFSLLWCGFAIWWEANALSSNSPLLFRLWGIPFVLVGLHLVFTANVRGVYEIIRRAQSGP